jgi:TPR repeat protein
MSLREVTAKPEVERPGYHQLANQFIDSADDPEALFERGMRLRFGISVSVNEEAGWEIIIKAAHLGHPVALAFCFKYGKGTEKDFLLALELFRQSAERGHPAGIIFRICKTVSSLFNRILTSTKLSSAFLRV